MVDECQEIIPVRASGIPQVDDRHLVAVVLHSDGPIVPGQVAFGIQGQEAHAAGAGIFEIWIQEKRRLAHAGSADHQTVDVVAVHQGGDSVLFALAAQDEALDLGQVLALPPLAGPEGNVLIGLFQFFFRTLHTPFLSEKDPDVVALIIPHRES